VVAGREGRLPCSRTATGAPACSRRRSTSLSLAIRCREGRRWTRDGAKLVIVGEAATYPADRLVLAAPALGHGGRQGQLEARQPPDLAGLAHPAIATVLVHDTALDETSRVSGRVGVRWALMRAAKTTVVNPRRQLSCFLAMRRPTSTPGVILSQTARRSAVGGAVAPGLA
jgi:hypothetical protein